jgi:riboflavin synthase
MFTGLVERVGVVEETTELPAPEGERARRLLIRVPDAVYLQDAVIGESIAVNGVCLTATTFENEVFTVDAVEETLRRTTLGALEPGSRVNLERAMLATARLGGHVVQGHVDGVGAVHSMREEGEGWWVTFEPPFELMRFLVEKGSVCIDGISLTVANVAYQRFSVALIPHTRAATTAGAWKPGVQVNLETDIIAKYVERLMQWSAGAGAPETFIIN